MSNIFLPRITSFRLIGFTPIFSREVDYNLNLGINVVLGGNGLGKTTLMQAIVYGLTGGAYNKEIESDKAKRWDHRYFHTRLNNHVSALVEIIFILGDAKILVQRGLTTNRVLKCEVATEVIKSMEYSQDMQIRFRTAIAQHGGYKRTEDFDYVIHKLLYLPETRRMIAWDQEVQSRLLMLFSPDVIDEESFRKSRGELKRDDTNKRHIRVAINKADKQLSRAPKVGPSSSAPDAKTKVPVKKEELPISHLIDQLKKSQAAIAAHEDELLRITGQLARISTEVESVRMAVDEREASLVATSLRKDECAHTLPLGKLLDNGICPSCGLVSRELQKSAQLRNETHQCLICGQPELATFDEELATLRSTMAEKIRAQHGLAIQFRNASARLSSLRQSTQRIEAEYSKIQSIETGLMRTILERQLPLGTSIQELGEMKERFELEERRFEFQVMQRQKLLTEQYQQFRDALAERLELLRSLYQDYATEFLGLPCSLVDTDMPNKLFRLKIYVPEFNNSIRKKESDCSEAQRFFLDIAFRMSFIDFVSMTGGQAASFLCETPENALDMSHISNVVDMFHRFCTQGHSVLLTANIQYEGLAQQILHKHPPAERIQRLLSMLDYGVPSEVQVRGMADLRAAIERTKNESN